MKNIKKNIIYIGIKRAGDKKKHHQQKQIVNNSFHQWPKILSYEEDFNELSVTTLTFEKVVDSISFLISEHGTRTIRLQEFHLSY